MIGVKQLFQVALTEIKKRYNMKDPVLTKLDILKPDNAIYHTFRKNIIDDL